MTIDDRYRAKLQATIAALRYWIPSIADGADATETDDADYWRLSVEPHVPGACPFELVLRTDGFHDLMIAGEVYEEQPTDDLELFVPLADAITAGRVIRRHLHSPRTGLPVAVATLVILPDGRQWRRSRNLVEPALMPAPDAIVIHDASFLPYRRDSTSG